MKKCPKCGYETITEKVGSKAWAYTKTNDNNKNDALKKAEIRQRIELGYGVPDIEIKDPENLGSVITEKKPTMIEWRQYDNQKDN